MNAKHAKVVRQWAAAFVLSDASPELAEALVSMCTPRQARRAIWLAAHKLAKPKYVADAMAALDTTRGGPVTKAIEAEEVK